MSTPDKPSEPAPARPRPIAGRWQKGATTAFLLLLLLAAGMAIFVLLRGRSAEPSRGILGAQPSSTDPRLAAARPLGPTDLAVFGAEVISVAGRMPPGEGGEDAVLAGSGCLLQAQLLEGPAVGHVTLRCAGRPLYRSTEPAGPERIEREQQLQELAGPVPGSHRYALRYLDRGERSGPRPELEVDTHAWQARLFRRGAEPWALVLHVGEASFPRWGAALGAARGDAIAPSARLRATFVAERGRAPAAEQVRAASCELYARGAPSAGRCRLLLRCGAQILLGAGDEPARCSFAAGRVIGAESRGEGDGGVGEVPRLSWKGSDLVLAGGAGEGWELSFRLDPPPACGLEGSWSGFAIDDKASPFTLALQSDGAAAKWIWSLGDKQAEHLFAPPSACDPLVELVEDAGPGAHRYLLELGPGWRSAGGRWQGAEGGVLAVARLR